MCFQFYEGKGYSEDFTDHMGKIVRSLEEHPEQVVTIQAEMDEVCENCPNNEGGVCTTQEKVDRYDREVLRLCGIVDGQQMSYDEFRSVIRSNILKAGHRAEICGDCCWNEICERKELV
jgi:hypothetical protein